MLDLTSREGKAIADPHSADRRIFSSPPTPLFNEKPPATPFPLASLGPLHPFAEALLAQTKAPDAIVAQCVLSAASLATQHLANAETLSGTAPLSLFFLTVAESGERKSVCHNIALTAVRQLEKERLSSFGVAKDVSDEVVETAPPPLRPHILFNDPTVEGIMRHFREGQPSIGVFSDEGGQFLGGAGMSSENKLKSGAAFSKLWDGSALDRARAGGDAPETFYDRRAALHLMIQPMVADRLLSDPTLRDQGLLSRMLLAYPESKIGSRFLSDNWRRTQEPPEFTAFHARVRDFLNSEPPNRTCSMVAPRTLALSEDAGAMLVSFYNEIEAAQADSGSLSGIRGFASKAPENACRIAGVLALFEDPDTNHIPAQSLADAIELMVWYLGEAERLLTAANVSDELREAERLRVWLVDQWKERDISIRNAQRNGPSSLRVASKLRHLFSVLERHGWLRRLPDGARETWTIVGQTHAL